MSQGARRPLPNPPLLLITDRQQAARPVADVVEAALAAGCRWVLLRDKDLPTDERRDLAHSLRRITRDRGALLSLADAPELAKEIAADGVHLPRDGDVATVRRRLGSKALIGLSAHDQSEAEQAFQSGADYVTLSPIFATASKPGYGPLLGLDGLRSHAEKLPGPVVALGGVTTETAAACMAHGAGGIAIMGEVMRAEDPTGETAAILEAIGQKP